jgi:hypothetical protein
VVVVAAEVELVEAAMVQVLVTVMGEAVGDTEQVLVMEVSLFFTLVYDPWFT